MSRRKLPRAIEKPDYTPLWAECGSCVYNALQGCQPVKPRIVPNSRFLVVLDQPDPVSVKHGELRTTVSQKLLERGMAESGADDVSYLYATACRRPKEASDKDEAEAIRACAKRLEAEIQSVGQPVNQSGIQWHLAVGEIAFRALSDRSGPSEPWRGSPMVGRMEATKLVPTWDPWTVGTAKGSRYAAVWATHLHRYVQLATGQLPPFEWPGIVVDDCAGALEAIAADAALGEEVSVDIETRGLGLDSEISCIGFATARTACCVQLPLSPASEELVRRILRSGVMVGQNISAFDRRVLSRAGYELTPNYEDTLLAASVLDPQLPKNLAALVGSEFHAEAHKAAFKADKETGVMSGMWDSTDTAVERERRIYCLKDAYTTLLVWRRQKERLKVYGQAHYERLKAKMPVAVQMAERGLTWDADHAERLKKYHIGKRDKIVSQMRKVVGPDFNPGSTAHLRKLFYETCKVAPFAWTDGGKPSTDEDVLTELLKSDNPFVVEAAQKVGEYRNHVKMVGTYVEGAKPLPGDPKVHGNWKPHTAVTGRWSCTKFDDGDKEWGCPFQVVPERMRRLFVAQPDMELMEADYAGLELRTLVLLSGAKHYEQMIADGVDMHLTNARQMFNMPDMDKKHPMRKATKVLSFLSHYGGGPQTAWQGLVSDEDIQKWMRNRGRVLTLREVGAMQKAYFKIHPEIPAWWARNIEEAQQRGYYLEPIFGRRVNFYGRPDFTFCQNFPNQSLGAEICDRAMMRIWSKLKQPEEGFVAAVHDALALEGLDGQRLKKLAMEEMPTTLTYEGRTMHFPVECKVDRRYVRVK